MTECRTYENNIFYAESLLIAPCKVIARLCKCLGMLTVSFTFVGVGHACAS